MLKNYRSKSAFFEEKFFATPYILESYEEPSVSKIGISASQSDMLNFTLKILSVSKIGISASQSRSTAGPQKTRSVSKIGISASQSKPTDPG